MLRSLKSLGGYKLQATDGKIGHAHDFYFDDLYWIVRYLVADTGKWLPGHKVLISPASLEEPSWTDKAFPVRLSTQQIQDSPDVSEDQPVSKQKEGELAEYYDWPIYWPIGHTGVPPHITTIRRVQEKENDATDTSADTHLRSFHEIKGYGCQAKDGEFGHIDDIIVEVNSWIVRYIVISTRAILPGKKVLVSPMWIEKIDWSLRKVYLSSTKSDIENSPEFNPKEPINRKYEQELYDYYGRPAYWKEEFDKAGLHF